MTIDKIKDEKVQCNINRETAKTSLMNMNILQLKKYYLSIKFKLQNKLCLLILIQEELQKTNKKNEEKEENKSKIYYQLKI